MGFNLAYETTRTGYKPAVEPFELSPGRTDQVVTNADVPRIIDNLDAGMGYSRRLESVPNGYAYAFPGYTRSPGTVFMPAGRVTPITLPAPALGTQYAGIQHSARFDGKIILIGGPQMMALSADGLTATTEQVFSTEFQGNGAAVFNNRLYVSGTAGGFAYRSVGGGWTLNPALYRHMLATATWRPLGVPTEVMLSVTNAFLNDTAVQWCPITADPMVSGSWSAPVAIGASRDGSVGPIVASPRHAYIYARDGIYDIDELGARSFNIAPWIGETVDSLNGHWGMATSRGLYYSHAQGLAYVETASGEIQYQPEWAQPGFGLPWEGRVAGQPFGGTFANGWGMMAFFTPPRGMDPGTGPYESYIMAGRRDPAGVGGTLTHGQASHIWHGAEAVIPGLVQHLKVYTVDQELGWPQLLICGAWFAFWQSLPKVGTPLQELIWGGQFQPADTSQLFLPADPWGRPSAVKQLLQLELVADRLNLGSDYLKVYAAADGAAWAEQGTAEAEAYTSLMPSPALQGRYISTRVDGYGQAVLRSLELRAAMGIELREARTYKLILAWDNALKGARARDTADPEARLLALHALLGRVCLLDDGTPGGPARVRVLQVQGGERRRVGGPARAGTGGAEGAWAIVVSVTVSFLDTPFRHDGSAEDRYDRDRIWA